jgi:NhaP-type Na+/H+ or K+/H+ antiporter
MTIIIALACGYFAGVLTVVVALIIMGRKLIKAQIAVEQNRLAKQVEEARLAKERLRQVQRGPRL